MLLNGEGWQAVAGSHSGLKSGSYWLAAVFVFFYFLHQDSTDKTFDWLAQKMRKIDEIFNVLYKQSKSSLLACFMSLCNNTWKQREHARDQKRRSNLSSDGEDRTWRLIYNDSWFCFFSGQMNPDWLEPTSPAPSPPLERSCKQTLADFPERHPQFVCRDAANTLTVLGVIPGSLAPRELLIHFQSHRSQVDCLFWHPTRFGKEDEHCALCFLSRFFSSRRHCGCCVFARAWFTADTHNNLCLLEAKFTALGVYRAGLGDVRKEGTSVHL